jgi:hypothetical protein
MQNKFVSLLLAFSLSGVVGVQISYANNQTEAQLRATAKVKERIQKRVGKRSRVVVVLRDGAKLKGHISEAGDDSFVLVAANTGAQTRLSYADVRQVKSGGGLSTGSKFLIGLGIAAGGLLILGIGMDWE